MSENVFIGEITEVEKAAANEGYRDGIKGVKITVKKVFKGTLKESDTVSFAQGGGSDCLW
jgi:hypothetical protein